MSKTSHVHSISSDKVFLLQKKYPTGQKKKKKNEEKK